MASVAPLAVKVNVFHTVDTILRMSASIREGVKSGRLEIQAAVYDAQSRKVEFLGRSPRQEQLLSSTEDWESLGPQILMIIYVI